MIKTKLKTIFQQLVKKNKGLKFYKQSLQYGLREKGGRNLEGRRIFRRASLTKRIYRFVDTKRYICPGIFGVILQHYLYDPNRSGFLSLIMFVNGVVCYILAPQYGKNQTHIFNLGFPLIKHDYGWSNYLTLIPAGTIIYNVEQLQVLELFLCVVQVLVCSFKKRCKI